MSNNYYEFASNTRIISGINTLERLPEILIEMGAKNIMLISGHVLNSLGVVDVVQNICEDGNVDVRALFIDVPNDGCVEVVRDIAHVYMLNNCEGLVAVGGGSVIDCAKSVKLLVGQDNDDIAPILGIHTTYRGRKTIPFVAIPTTAGTGSEVTFVAVVSDNKRKVKVEILNREVAPNVCIIDPRFTLTLQPFPTLMTAYDALAHAIESFSCTQKNKLSDNLARLAILGFKEGLNRVVKCPDNLEYRLDMLNIACLSGLAFSNSMVGAVHSIGHTLGNVSGLNHGMTISLLLADVMEFNLDSVGDLYSNLLYFFSGEEVYLATPADARGQRLIDDVRALYNDMADIIGAPKKLSEVGVTRDMFPEIARQAMRDGATFLNIKELTTKDIIDILERAYV